MLGSSSKTASPRGHPCPWGSPFLRSTLFARTLRGTRPAAAARSRHGVGANAAPRAVSRFVVRTVDRNHPPLYHRTPLVRLSPRNPTASAPRNSLLAAARQATTAPLFRSPCVARPLVRLRVVVRRAGGVPRTPPAAAPAAPAASRRPPNPLVPRGSPDAALAPQARTRRDTGRFGRSALRPKPGGRQSTARRRSPKPPAPLRPTTHPVRGLGAARPAGRCAPRAGVPAARACDDPPIPATWRTLPASFPSGAGCVPPGGLSTRCTRAPVA